MLHLYDETGKTKVSVYNDRNDNVVAIKSKLRDKINRSEIELQLLKGKPPSDKNLLDGESLSDRKLLEVESLSDGELLDNNRYLPDGTARLYYRIIEGYSSDVIIKVARNKYKIPKLIQIGKSDSISQLENVLTRFSNGVVNLAIFTESGDRLDRGNTVEQSGLFDDCEIRVCDRKDVTLSLSVTTFKSLNPSLTINCGILDTVQHLKESIHDKLKNLDIDEMAIFTKSEFLETDRQLIDYSIGDGDLIFYVKLIKKDEIELGNKFKKGQFATLHYGRNKTTETDIVVKKYSLNKGDKLSNFKALKYEITTFLQLRDDANSRFVKLNSMFEDRCKFCIGMEHMKRGSLDALVPLNEHFDDPESTLINFSIQISDGLAFLHEKPILYRSMKCSSVLLDETRKTVKLGSFQFSKIIQSYQKDKMLGGVFGSRPHTYNWAAPEMLLNKPYGVKADIWSFGATLVEMVTGQAPYANFKPPQVKNKITTLEKIEYTQPDWMSNDLKDTIEKCLKPNQEMRPTANELKELFVTMKEKTKLPNL